MEVSAHTYISTADVEPRQIQARPDDESAFKNLAATAGQAYEAGELAPRTAPTIRASASATVTMHGNGKAEVIARVSIKTGAGANKDMNVEVDARADATIDEAGGSTKTAPAATAIAQVDTTGPAAMRACAYAATVAEKPDALFDTIPLNHPEILQLKLRPGRLLPTPPEADEVMPLVTPALHTGLDELRAALAATEVAEIYLSGYAESISVGTRIGRDAAAYLVEKGIDAGKIKPIAGRETNSGLIPRLEVIAIPVRPVGCPETDAKAKTADGVSNAVVGT